jgi:hypothetical protein
LKVLFTALLLFSLSEIHSQKLTFDIFLFGNPIGQTVVERTVKNDSITTYVLNSHSEAHVLFTHRVITLYYDITYKREKLFYSFCKHTRNDEVHFTTITTNGSSYTIKLDNITKTFPFIDCSTVKLFFAEPCNPVMVFSERLGEWRELKKTGEGTYKAEMSDGITYYYKYKDGKLVELEMSKGLIGSVYIRPHQ